MASVMMDDFKKEESPEVAQHVPDKPSDSDDEAMEPANAVEEDLGEGHDPRIADLMNKYGIDDDQAAQARDLIYRWGLEEYDAVERVRRSATA
jgi:hypothetical protein